MVGVFVLVTYSLSDASNNYVRSNLLVVNRPINRRGGEDDEDDEDNEPGGKDDAS
jgi:hypothetical protein